MSYSADLGSQRLLVYSEWFINHTMAAVHYIVCINQIASSLHVPMARADVGIRSAYLALPAINQF